jgi:hypothetical protein
LSNNPHLTPKQKTALKRRQPKQPLIDPEENWGGYCKGGCGKCITGSYYCPDCKKTQAEKNFKLNAGEVELYRGNVGKPEDKIVRQVVAIDAASIEMEEMTWVWKHRIPDEAISWIMGQPNNAKSLLTIEIAACATTGRDWPDGEKNTMGAVNVLMYCGEDSLSKVVIPRLTAASADLKRIKFLNKRSFREVAGENNPTKRAIDLSQDLDTLLRLLKANPGFRLIICDPITGIFGEKQITKDAEINPVLEDLIDFCEQAHVAFIGVTHVPKRQTNSSIEKISGGSSVGGKAKSAFMLARDPDSDDKHDHLLTMVKWNYTGKTAGMKYSTVLAEVEHKGKKLEVAKIEWGESTEMIADDVLAAQNSRKDEHDRQADKCEAFLRTFLAAGPRRSPEVYDAAKEQGFGKTTVKRSLKNIGGDHVDRRAQNSGYWMTLTPHLPFVDLATTAEPHQLLVLAAGEQL